MQIEVTARRLGDHLLLGVHGDVDLATSPTLRSHLMKALLRRSRVVTDLSAVEFMDATGWSALCEGHRRAAELGGSLRLASPQRIVRRLLAITALDQRIPVYSTASEAIEHPVKAGPIRTTPVASAGRW